MVLKKEYCSPVAQSVERLAVNQHVRGSSPRWGAKTIMVDFIIGIGHLFFVEFQASTIVINKTSNNNVLTGFVSVSDGLCCSANIFTFEYVCTCSLTLFLAFPSSTHSSHFALYQDSV